MIQMHHIPGQRLQKVTSSNLDDFIFNLDRIPFKAQSGLNDLWIETELDTIRQEADLVSKIRELIGRRYPSLASAPIKEHCS